MPSRNERIERKTQLLEQLDPMRGVKLEGKLKARMLSLGWRFPFARVCFRAAPLRLCTTVSRAGIQINHFPDIGSIGLDARSFEKHVVFLKRNFDPISLATSTVRGLGLAESGYCSRLDASGITLRWPRPYFAGIESRRSFS